MDPRQPLRGGIRIKEQKKEDYDMNRENQWKSYTDSQLKELMALAEDYKKFMTSAKTERECVEEAVRLAEKAGCRNLEDVIAKGESLKAGDRVYAVWMKKTMALFTIGRQPLEKGMRILGAHIDSPRLDLKQNPLYEDTEMAYLDLHYYGGIKKYQWTAIPLAIHGVVAKKDGSLTEVVIGEKEEDPVFCVTDLLIHLAAKQMEKPLAKGVEGENLDLLIGSRPLVIRNASESDCAGKENASDSADAGKEKAPASIFLTLEPNVILLRDVPAKAFSRTVTKESGKLVSDKNESPAKALLSIDSTPSGTGI